MSERFKIDAMLFACGMPALEQMVDQHLKRSKPHWKELQSDEEREEKLRKAREKRAKKEAKRNRTNKR